MRRVCLLALALLGCGETAQEVVSFPVHAAGTGERSFESEGGWTVTLERAELAFGPMYLCATPFADIDVCPRAEAELLSTASIDALDATPRMIGNADGITGTVRSAMFDYGISWRITEPMPTANEGAPEDASAIFVVRATRDDRELRVTARARIEPRDAGVQAVIGASTGTHDISGREALTVRFDPAAWWRRVDFEALAASDEDGDGEIELAAGDTAYDALVIAMTTGSLPRFEWTNAP